MIGLMPPTVPGKARSRLPVSRPAADLFLPYPGVRPIVQTTAASFGEAKLGAVCSRSARRKGSSEACSGCCHSMPSHARLGERRFEFISLWGFSVFLLYAMRRVDCWARTQHPICRLRLGLLNRSRTLTQALVPNPANSKGTTAAHPAHLFQG
jgi:hypothetical protein